MLVAILPLVVVGLWGWRDEVNRLAVLILLAPFALGAIASSRFSERAWAIALQMASSLAILFPLGANIVVVRGGTTLFIANCVLFAGFAGTVASFSVWGERSPEFARRRAVFGAFLLLINLTCATVAYSTASGADRDVYWIAALLVINGAISIWAYRRFAAALLQTTSLMASRAADT